VATVGGDLLRSSAIGDLTDAEELGRHVAVQLLGVGAGAANETPLAAGRFEPGTTRWWLPSHILKES
jgi:hypothetical protein